MLRLTLALKPPPPHHYHHHTPQLGASQASHKDNYNDWKLGAESNASCVLQQFQILWRRRQVCFPARTASCVSLGRTEASASEALGAPGAGHSASGLGCLRLCFHDSTGDSYFTLVRFQTSARLANRTVGFLFCCTVD
eukprot:scpid65954/ scgid10428/ 